MLHTEFEVRHPRCVEPKLLDGKSTVKTQLYLLAMSGWITYQFTTTCFGLYRPSSGCTTSCYKVMIFIYVLLVPEGQMAEAWEPFKKQRSFGNRAALDRTVLTLFVFKGLRQS